MKATENNLYLIYTPVGSAHTLSYYKVSLTSNVLSHPDRNYTSSKELKKFEFSENFFICVEQDKTSNAYSLAVESTSTASFSGKRYGFL